MKIKIVDQMMGSGKTSAAINYINNSTDEHFIVITPYLEEIERYKSKCPTMHFKEPVYDGGTKLQSIKKLIRNGENIVSTHALFHKFDEEVINLCRVLGYTLIMDEVAEVVENFTISKDDINNLLDRYCVFNEETGLLTWREDQQDYEGKFSDVKNLCNLGSLARYRENMLVWLFPVEVFKAFENVYVLTYMFNAQLQRYYYDYYGIEYDFVSVRVSGEKTYTFIKSSAPVGYSGIRYRGLVNILDNEKLNRIGDGKYDLSVAWFKKNRNTAVMQKLKNNTQNFFTHIRNSRGDENLWTTFKEARFSLKGKGYTKGFLAINARATNQYRDRTNIAYLANRFVNPVLIQFFIDHGVEVDEDGFALSEMIQFIWRSAVRDGKEIWVYVPSRRMRNLLKDWLYGGIHNFRF